MHALGMIFLEIDGNYIVECEALQSAGDMIQETVNKRVNRTPECFIFWKTERDIFQALHL